MSRVVGLDDERRHTAKDDCILAILERTSPPQGLVKSLPNIGVFPYTDGCGLRGMQSNHVTRRALLSGVAAAGVTSLSGCSALSGLTGETRSGSGRYLPGDDRFWGGKPSRVSWFSPQKAVEHQAVLKETGLYELFQYAFGIQGEDLSFLELDRIYYAMPQGLRVYEGAFTANDLRTVFESDAWSMDGEYEGYTLGTVQRYQERAIGVQDGRGIFVDDTAGIEDPRIGVKATIDTVQGTVDPYLEREPDVEAAEKFLDTGVWWEFLTHQQGGLQGLRSEANSFSVVSSDAYRVKKLFGFTRGSEIREDEATAFATGMEDTVFSLTDPSYTRVDTVVVLEETHSFASWR